MARELPKVGDKISVEKFHVSETNVNYGEPFGESEEDKKLVANLRVGKKIVQPFKARPEGDGYGVYEGRRRFLGAKEAGFEEFVLGEDCLIKSVSDEEAEDGSWIENYKGFHKGMNAIARAERLNKIVSRRATGLRGTARYMGIPVSTLSEHLSVLRLSKRMQEAVRKGSLSYSDALTVARLKLGEFLQDELAEVLETEGLEAFKRELVRVSAGKMKRGIPKDVYEIDRLSWDKRNRKMMGYYETVTKAAEKRGMKNPEYIKDFLIRHINEIERETA